MRLCKIFQRHQPHPPPQESQPASRGSGPAYPMSRTAQWVAQQAHQEYQLVHRRPQQSHETHQTSTLQEARTAHRRAQRAPRRRPKVLLMDLSSLEGPPIEDSRLVTTPRSTIPHIREDPATPNSTPPCLLWKPLPPRPASAEPQFSRQQRRRPDIPPTGNNIDPSRNDGNLTRVPAQRGRRSPTEDESFPGHAPPNEGSRSPHNISHQQSGRPRLRSHCSGPLVWLEDEEQWIVAHPPSSRSSHPPVTRLLTRLRNATTRPARMYTDMSDLDISDVSAADLARRDHPPDYESHQFSPTHVQRLTYGPASRPRASARRAHWLT